MLKKPSPVRFGFAQRTGEGKTKEFWVQNYTFKKPKPIAADLVKMPFEEAIETRFFDGF